MASLAGSPIHYVRINTFDDGNQRLSRLPNKYLIVGYDDRGKYTLEGNGYTFTISAWKVDPIFLTFDELPVGTRVCKVNTCINGKQFLHCNGTVMRHEPAHTWNGREFPDAVWVNFDGTVGQCLAALTDVRRCA
jgi:hypothetical protein